MDQLWFYQNILAFEPHVVSLQSLLTTTKSIQLRPESQADDHKDRRPPRLDIVIPRKPQLFQLPSSYSTPTSSRRKLGTRQKSLSELEKYELKGFMDLGFTFPKDKLSEYMMSMVPGLQRLGDDDDEEEDESKRGVVKRPYLSEAWLFSNPVGYSQLRMLPKSLEGANDSMKRHIKYWARRVAMIVYQE